MKKLNLRIIPDVKETVYRDVQIGGNQNLESLHQIILKAFELEGDQMASFFETNEFWEQKKEIPMITIAEEDSKLMKDYEVSQLLKAEDDKLLYIYDFLLFRQFFVEVLSVEDTSDTKGLPKVIKRFGDSPKVSKSDENAENAESILLEALLGEDFTKDLEDFDEDNFEEDEDWEDYNDGDYDDRY